MEPQINIPELTGEELKRWLKERMPLYIETATHDGMQLSFVNPELLDDANTDTAGQTE